LSHFDLPLKNGRVLIWIAETVVFYYKVNKFR